MKYGMFLLHLKLFLYLEHTSICCCATLVSASSITKLAVMILGDTGEESNGTFNLKLFLGGKEPYSLRFPTQELLIEFDCFLAAK